jgi:hypothetical protein
MSLRTISRSAIGGYFKLLRLPLDAAFALRPRNRQGDSSGATIALDRMEATLRGIAGRTLGDEELVRDAERRRLAANERERARRLRSEAEKRSEQAGERLSKKAEKADHQRHRASQRATERKKQAEQSRRAETRRIAEIEARRRRASKNAAARKEEAIEDRSKRARLQQLNGEADALAKQKAALTAKNESQRLRRAATKTKAARKRSRA